MVFVYNPKLVRAGEITSWKDLLDPAWKGKIAFADPSVSGSSYTALVTMLCAVDADEDAVVQAFAANLDGRQLTSSGAVLSNVAGGIMLLISKPFTVGDYVSCDGIEGAVRAVDLAYTTFTTVDNKEIFVPNSQIVTAKIVNYNALGRRRVDLTYTASYDAPTETVRTAILEAVAAFPQVTDEPAPTVVLSEYGASSISYLVRLWVSAADYWTVYYGMNEKVRETFAAHGVEMTYDHLNVHMIKD